MSRALFLFFVTLSFCWPTTSQEKLKFIRDQQTQFQIPVSISQNLIVVPVSINGSETMRFILDSGISHTIITELTGIDTVSLNLAHEVHLEGLGEGDPLIAWHSEKNVLVIKDPLVKESGVIGKDMQVYMIPEDRFGFSKQFGIQINGLIGADFFSHFVVDINYQNKFLTFYDRANYNFKRRTKRHSALPLIFKNGKPYIEVELIQENGENMVVKLLIDTGASMAMWLSVYSDERILLPEVTIPSLLGQGLNGDINGVNGRVKMVKIGPYDINRPIVSFPDSSGIIGMLNEEGRNGTLGNEILKRFHVIFDYQGKQIFLKPNKDFRTPYNYNRSGLEIEKPHYAIPMYRVYDVVPGSPAEKAGILAGDQIVMINYINASNLELDRINSILYGTDGKTVRIQIDRNGETIKTKFTLDGKL